MTSCGWGDVIRKDCNVITCIGDVVRKWRGITCGGDVIAHIITSQTNISPPKLL